MAFPRAYFLTWTTYGTWLHGDERGSVDDEHNVYKTPYAPPNADRVMRHFGRLVNQPVLMDGNTRRIVHETIFAHCGIRGWTIKALNVRTNHVHLVVSCGRVDPDTVMRQLKAWCTRRLREAGLAGPQADVWTEDGSKRYLWDEESVKGACTYVVHEQGTDLV
jgi:REP element-mobilizing transposase RayT